MYLFVKGLVAVSSDPGRVGYPCRRFVSDNLPFQIVYLPVVGNSGSIPGICFSNYELVKSAREQYLTKYIVNAICRIYPPMSYVRQ